MIYIIYIYISLSPSPQDLSSTSDKRIITTIRYRLDLFSPSVSRVVRLDADELTGFIVGQGGIHKSRDLIPLPKQNEKVLLVFLRNRWNAKGCNMLQLTIVWKRPRYQNWSKLYLWTRCSFIFLNLLRFTLWLRSTTWRNADAKDRPIPLLPRSLTGSAIHVLGPTAGSYLVHLSATLGSWRLTPVAPVLGTKPETTRNYIDFLKNGRWCCEEFFAMSHHFEQLQIEAS